MAIQMNVVSSTGLEVEKAYFRIDEYSCDKLEQINARVRAYVSREAQKEGRSSIEGTEDIIELTGDYVDGAVNTKKQIYEHMKTLSKYSGAVDVLE